MRLLAIIAGVLLLCLAASSWNETDPKETDPDARTEPLCDCKWGCRLYRAPRDQEELIPTTSSQDQPSPPTWD